MTDRWTLPYGVFTVGGETRRRVGVRVGDEVLDLGAVPGLPYAVLLTRGSLDPLLAAGPAVWREVREALLATVAAGAPAVALHALTGVRLHLPWTVGDYVDFYSSEHHATNVGRILRPDGAALLSNWRHLPVGYHGRAGTVIVSGTPIRRPRGQRLLDGVPAHGPTRRLDVEAEIGFVVGTPSTLGEPVPVAAYADHVFGIVVVNDWSARDLQAWEYQPLGPFLAKSFATSVSPWVVPLAALDAARVPGPPQDPPVMPYLARGADTGLDIALEIRWNGTTVSRPPFASMYWTPAQQLAHLTVNGASVRTGDLYASGTVSGPEVTERGSFLELTWGGTEPVTLGDGSTRTFLADGDEVTIAATAPGPAGILLDLGAVTARIVPTA